MNLSVNPISFIARVRNSHEHLSKAFSMSRNRKYASSSSFSTWACISFSSMMFSGRKLSGTKPFCGSLTNCTTALFIRVASTLVITL